MYEDEDSKKYARYNLHYRILSPKIEGFVFFFLMQMYVHIFFIKRMCRELCIYVYV